MFLDWMQGFWEVRFLHEWDTGCSSLFAGSQARPDLVEFTQRHVIILHKPLAALVPPGGRMFRRGGTGWHLHSLIQKLNGSFIKISKIHF